MQQGILPSSFDGSVSAFIEVDYETCCSHSYDDRARHPKRELALGFAL